ncbi:DUF58 domain-containing protein [Salinibacillus xinjiangensis]|uniref:DUF58 domain-containing protein n=1 Tax=Salinibacillus xinjiangensis TaxID=1229268 RepID=A0A6G1X8X6_9BACI|nr:DUF58 domain-containing protein [Salinibacillus xinjiangensis]MRG87389.1 DUF58 domain-containing protein [Salinibacillus xinjiangensis]
MKKFILNLFKILLILIPLGVLYSYAMFQGGFVSWFLFFGSLPILIYMALLLIYPMSRLKIERSIQPVITEAGNSVTVEIKFKRDRFFPLYYCVIEDLLPDTLDYRDTKRKKFSFLSNPDALKQKQRVKKVIFPWFKQTFSFTYKINELPRGEHVFQHIRISTGDFIGIIKKEETYPVETKLLVYPSERKVLLHKQAQSFEEGASASFNRTVKNTMVVSGVREYMPGDRVSWIDWKASAKKNTMMTKEFDQEKSQDMYLMFDGTAHENLNWLAFEGAVEVGVSLIDVLKEESARLVFSVLGSDRTTVPINKNQMSKEQVKHHMTTIQPKPAIPFGRLVKQETGVLPKGYLMMVITTQLSLELYDTLLQLRQKSPRVVLYLIQSDQALTEDEKKWLKYLRSSDVVVNLLSEGQLMKLTIEVNA